MSEVPSHRASFVVFLAAALVWGFAFPVGIQRGTTWSIGNWIYDIGGREVTVTGELVYEAHGYGFPAGFVRFGRYTYGPLAAPRQAAPASGAFDPTPPFTADYTIKIAQGFVPLPASPDLIEKVRAHLRENGNDPEPEPAGLSFHWPALVPCAVFTLGYFLVCCRWWVAARRWKWNDARDRSANFLGLARLAVAPWLVGSWTSWVLWNRVRALRPTTMPTLASDELVVFGTILALSCVLVLVITRHEWQRGLTSSATRD